MPLSSKEECLWKGKINLLWKIPIPVGIFLYRDGRTYRLRLTKRFRKIEISIIQHRFQRKILRENLIMWKSKKINLLAPPGSKEPRKYKKSILKINKRPKRDNFRIFAIRMRKCYYHGSTFYYSHMSFDSLHTSEQSSERSREHQQLFDAFMQDMSHLEKLSPDTAKKLSELSFAELQEVAQKSERQQSRLQEELKTLDEKKSKGFWTAFV